MRTHVYTIASSEAGNSGDAGRTRGRRRTAQDARRLEVEEALRRAEEFIQIQQAAALLGQGELVAFPTETVYGLGANALSEEAVAKIFAAKGRPADNPLIVHIGRREELRKVALSWPAVVEGLTNRFWPGPLTLVLPRRPEIPSNVCAGLTTVAVRMPDHPLALRLLQAVSLPIAAPSANRSGRPSPTCAQHVLEDMDGLIAAVIDGGPTREGVESTVLDLSGAQPVILRPGSITREMLLPYLPNLRESSETESETPKAPGMKYTHYAPKAPLYLYCGPADAVQGRIEHDIDMWRRTNRRVALLTPGPFYSSFAADLVIDLSAANGAATERGSTDLVSTDLSSEEQLHRVASQLFAALRRCDDEKVGIILAQGVEPTGMGEAIMNRLGKAAREIIYVEEM